MSFHFNSFHNHFIAIVQLQFSIHKNTRKNLPAGRILLYTLIEGQSKPGRSSYDF